MGLQNGQGGLYTLSAWVADSTVAGEAEASTEKADAACGTEHNVLTAKELIEFIQVYASTLLAAGGQTSRVDRTACRIAQAYGFEVELAIFPKHIMSCYPSSIGFLNTGLCLARISRIRH